MKTTASILFAVALLVICFWVGGHATPSEAIREPSTAEEATQAAIESGSLRATSSVTRTRVPEAPVVPRTFDEFVVELTNIGIEVWEKIEADDEEAARPIDDRARSLLITMTNTIQVPDEKALDRLTRTASTDESLNARVRFGVLYRILSDGLKERWTRYEFSGKRRVADQLTAAILGCLSQSEVLASTLGRGLLVDSVYLGSSHEVAVLELVDLSTEVPFLESVSSKLLLTLWRNLVARGERSSGKLASLALLFKDDGNPSRRLAAFAHLLTAENGRYRDVVLRHVLRSKDIELAVEVGHTAASELPPKTAVEVLAQLHQVGGERLMGAFMLLGSRSTEELRLAYEQRLADNVEPKLRAELIYGAGFEHGPDEIDLAKLAFDNDPDVEVRQRAMFVLSTCGDAVLAERTLMAAIDDPVIDADPIRLAAIVMALRNLAQDGDRNGLARVGQRLLTHPRLRPQDRRELEEILRQHLPTGSR